MATKKRPQKSAMQSLAIGQNTVRFAPALLILICLTLMALDKIDARPIEKMQTATTDIMAPMIAAASQPFVTFSESFDSITTMRSLKADNIRLQKENAQLKAWYETALKLQAENKSFRELLNVKADPDMAFITARVVSDPGGAFVKSLLVPVGTRDHVSRGNAVMSGKGLVGRITEAGDRSARVLLATDLNSRIPVVIQNTRTRAILAGKNENLLKLERLPIDSGLTVGQRVVTSGDGGQLPADIPVGTISSVGPDGVYVQLLADTERMTHVQIINANLDPSLQTGTVSPKIAE